MSSILDDATNSPPATCEEENETKEEHVLKKVAIAKEKAEEQAAHDKKRKWMKMKRDTREGSQQRTNEDCP